MPAAPIIAAVAAVAGTGYAVYSGERAQSAQRQGLRRQQAAQQLALEQAAGAKRRAEQDAAAANQKQPNVGAILAAEKSAAKNGSTLLTGDTGIDPFKLGSTSLLGG